MSVDFFWWFGRGGYTDFLDQHISLFEDSLKQGHEALKANYANGSGNMGRDLYRHKIEALAHSGQLLRESFFVSLMAYLENTLKELCDHLQERDQNVALTTSDFGFYRGTLDRAKIYLTKVLRVNYPFGESSEWQKITEYQKLRNDIVHRGGSAKKSKKFVQKEPLLELARTKVIIQKGFCEDAIRTIDIFLEDLVEHC